MSLFMVLRVGIYQPVIMTLYCMYTHILARIASVFPKQLPLLKSVFLYYICLYCISYDVSDPGRFCTSKSWDHRKRIRQKKRQRSSLLFGERNWFNSMPHYSSSTRMIWRNGWIEEQTIGRMDALEKYKTKPPPSGAKWVFFQKHFFKSSLLLNC